MNDKIKEFIISDIKAGLEKCTPKQVAFFKRVFANEKYLKDYRWKTASVDEIIASFGEQDYEVAMNLIDRTLAKKEIEL